MSVIEVIIAHGDALARAHLQSLVPEETVLQQAGNFDDLLSALRERPTIQFVVVDWSLPGLSGHIGVNYLAAHFPGLSITVLYSMAMDVVDDHLEPDSIAGCIPKEYDEPRLRAALGIILGGGIFPCPPRPAEAPEVSTDFDQRNFLEQELTARQVEVLRLLAQGHSNREIAQHLDITEGTAKVHVNALFRSLGVHNRVSAAAVYNKLFKERNPSRDRIH